MIELTKVIILNKDDVLINKQYKESIDLYSFSIPSQQCYESQAIIYHDNNKIQVLKDRYNVFGYSNEIKTIIATTSINNIKYKNINLRKD